MNKSYFLYAEDDEDDVAFMRDMVPAIDNEKSVVHVSNGFEVIDFLQHIKQGESYPGLIILDINMPRLNGLDTLELLRTDDMYRLIPVVMFTTRIKKSDDEICNRLGVDIIVKPTQYAHWQIIVKKFCQYCEGVE